MKEKRSWAADYNNKLVSRALRDSGFHLHIEVCLNMDPRLARGSLHGLARRFVAMHALVELDQASQLVHRSNDQCR